MAHVALDVLFYVAPSATILTFLSAKALAGCLFHEASQSAGSPHRRYPAIAIQILLFATIVLEGITNAAASAHDPARWPIQSYFFYLVLMFFLHLGLALGLLENPKPLWYPYAEAWFVNLALEVPILVLSSRIYRLEDGYARTQVAMKTIRVVLSVSQLLLAGYFALADRRRSVKLDAESEALLAASAEESTENGHATGPESTSSANGSANGTAKVNGAASKPDGKSTDDDEFDEEDRKNEIRKDEASKKMREAGSVWNYLKSYKIFIPIVVPWKHRFTQACLGVIGLVVVAERFLNFLLPRQLGIVVNELTASAGTGIVPWAAMGLWIFYQWAGSSAGLDLLKSEAEMVVSQYVTKALEVESFSHIMGLSMDFHTAKSSGELIAAINQGSSMSGLIQFILFETAPMLVDLVVAFFVVYNLFDIYMALILFASGTVYLYMGVRLTGWGAASRRKYKATQRAQGAVQNEAINNWTTVSNFNNATYESNRFSESVDKNNTAEWWYTQTWYIGGGAQSFVMLAGRALANLLAVYRVAQGEANIGAFVTLNAYWSRLETPLALLQYSTRRIQTMLVDSERLLELLVTVPNVVSKPGAPPLQVAAGEVRFDNVSFAYDPRKPTLQDISFTVKPGQTVALVGETGGGKSTILKLLYRHYDVTGGSIKIDGQDIRDVQLDTLRDSFGLVPQDPALFNISLYENIRYARLEATEEEIHKACRAAAIHAKIDSFPDKYKTIVGERGMKLSGGEMQRVAIARALLRDAPFVLLDEATSAIDAETESSIQAAFKELTAGRTTFVVAHRLATIQHADLIVVIQEGKIVQMGTHDQLFAQEGKYRALWAKQLNKDVQGVIEDLTAQDSADKKDAQDDSSEGTE
ncbi:putative ABC transporter [Dissoconium aciculare CBS 342.82]|uniref:ABC transporter n=1 Tax=Dissoconium aciculare CBS 342.82 TaxID=1314786 RepID=A0A6J3MFC6_9PEZI|nr:putative ABC transporter [Dissoconium aciculare CBS 342.82]KAF1826716.1 putative ABC transporter [Dissoconium aciculare CBS 342.82]